MIAAIIHNLSSEKHTKQTEIQYSTRTFLPGLHCNLCFFITNRLMLPRRCLDLLREPQKRSRQ